MIRETGDMFDFYEEADLFLVTTNSSLRNGGELVMGAGAAKQLRDREEKIPLYFGRRVQDGCGRRGTYGLITTSGPLAPGPPTTTLGAFQTKHHWKNESSRPLIVRATAQLLEWCEKHRGAEVHLNYPGIGHGKLSKVDVGPIINTLPDQVHIWTYE